MVKIVIRLKSGFELPIECEEANFQTSQLTGGLAGYKLKGCKNNRPIFLQPEDIECVWQVLQEGEEE